MMKSKERPVAWQIRCLKCDNTEPWKKSVVRIKTAGRKYIFGRCPQCKRIHIRVIEQKPQNPTVKEP